MGAGASLIPALVEGGTKAHAVLAAEPNTDDVTGNLVAAEDLPNPPDHAFVAKQPNKRKKSNNEFSLPMMPGAFAGKIKKTGQTILNQLTGRPNVPDIVGIINDHHKVMRAKTNRISNHLHQTKNKRLQTGKRGGKITGVGPIHPPSRHNPSRYRTPMNPEFAATDTPPKKKPKRGYGITDPARGSGGPNIESHTGKELPKDYDPRIYPARGSNAPNIESNTGKELPDDFDPLTDPAMPTHPIPTHEPNVHFDPKDTIIHGSGFNPSAPKIRNPKRPISGGYPRY